MKKHVIIAPLGGPSETIFIGIKEFPTERVVLIARPDDLREAENIKKDLARFKVPAAIERINGPLWDETFRIVKEIAAATPKELEVLINVASGKEMMRCAATSASFVNGLKAFGVDEQGQVVLLPVLKFSYYTLLSDRKMKLLSLLAQEDCCASLEEISRRTKMSLSLVSYHINGNLKSEGLKQLGLIETAEQSGRVHVSLTTMGRLLLKGYV